MKIEKIGNLCKSFYIILNKDYLKKREEVYLWLNS